MEGIKQTCFLKSQAHFGRFEMHDEVEKVLNQTLFKNQPL